MYTSATEIQNTLIIVNYTVQSTDYCFVVIDSDAPVTAQFNITLHKELYHESDYNEECAIAGRAECELSVPKHKCLRVSLLIQPTHVTYNGCQSTYQYQTLNLVKWQPLQ